MTKEHVSRYAFTEDELSIDLKKLMLLKVLLETESLAKTSAYLGVAVSSASRDLSHLREIFKDPLFVRSSNRMLPTDKMRRLGSHLDKVFSNIGELLSLNKNQTSDFFGTIRVAANDNCFSVFIGSQLDNLIQKMRRFKIEVYPASIGSPEALRRGEVDFLIAQDPYLQLDANFHCKALLTSPHVLAMRTGHPALRLLRDAPDKIDDVMRQYPTIQTPVSMPSGYSGLPPAQNLVQGGLLQTPYFISALILAGKSDALTICPRALISAMGADLTLDWVELTAAEPWRPCLYWHERTHDDPLHQCFRGMIELWAKHLSQIEVVGPA